MPKKRKNLFDTPKGKRLMESYLKGSVSKSNLRKQYEEHKSNYYRTVKPGTSAILNYGRRKKKRR